MQNHPGALQKKTRKTRDGRRFSDCVSKVLGFGLGLGLGHGISGLGFWV